jgi:hypothetical protein
MTPEMNESLCKFFSEEISDALFQMGPLKVPRPDGLPARFFQWNWVTLKTDVIRGGGGRDFFDTGTMPQVINDTASVLIPKKDDPELLKDYPPISLCN